MLSHKNRYAIKIRWWKLFMYSTIAVCADGAKEERIYGKLKEIFEVKGGENMKRIVQICLIMTGIFWGLFMFMDLQRIRF